MKVLSHWALCTSVIEFFEPITDSFSSNGIRFSISDLSPPTARILPTIYQDRSAISLYDAQYASGIKAPVPPTIVKEVLAALLRFKSTCQDFSVPDDNIRIVATEATRNAENKDDLRRQIQDILGWTVVLLSKHEEGRLGAMGIASSFKNVDGMCIDMGGGSLQLTHVSAGPEGKVIPSTSVSHPYGAAALMKARSTLDDGDLMDLQREIATTLQDTMNTATEEGVGYNLYLSGGGFRGWGHFLMSQKTGIVQAYPIPIVNGYSVEASDFFSSLSDSTISTTSHRISTRRASQTPAVQLVIRALAQTRIHISRVFFAQGGVREGLLFDALSPPICAQNPLVAATLLYAPRSAPILLNLLRDASPSCIDQDLLMAIVNMLYIYDSMPKDVASAVALRSTTTGLLAGAHGLSHDDRAMLALVLCERWDAKVPVADTDFCENMLKILGPEMRWWAKFVGRMAKGIASLYPAGIVRGGDQRSTITASFPRTESMSASAKSEFEIDHCNVHIHILVKDAATVSLIAEWKDDLKKLSKKKHWGNDPQWGYEVEVKVTRV